MRADHVWLIIGFIGQAAFAMRFLVQWIYSERYGRSLIPVYFWYFSLAGGMTLFAYAVHRRDPVFIVGQCTGVFIYARNLQFIYRERRKKPEDSPENLS
ncbi:MAG: lipid-A-disaccharide synthase N-terminal domain-containing protein [Syntrophobacterales bacterium]